MKNLVCFSIFIVSFCFVHIAFTQSQQVKVLNKSDGMMLTVNEKPFIVNGINWDYVPIGSTITDPGIWSKSDNIIKQAIDGEMSLLKNMGVNAIRTYDIAPRWIKYIYEQYGIYTMLNITFGAYGVTVNGAYIPQTNYADPAQYEVLMNDARNMVNKYKDTPGLLLYMIGNENNYHLSWTGAETEDIPINDKSDGIKLAAKALYKAINDATKIVKSVDENHPVAICNGDLLYLDIIKEQCPDIDIYGTNMYRGISFGDAFSKVKNELNKPILFAEFGADAFNARDNKEDQYSQAYYNVGNWREIYENVAGLGKSGNSLGGFTFQFSDGWWKYKQTENLDIHDNAASWSNGGYSRDIGNPGDNNMNEEWFGIAAKGPTDPQGLYELYPRAAYYALKEVHSLNPYKPGLTPELLASHFNGIQLTEAMLKARADKAALAAQAGGKLKISQLRAEFTTFNTGGTLLTTPSTPAANNSTYPNKTGFDNMESLYVGVEGRPAPNMRANVNVNITGNVAGNPIDQIFYENRANPIQVNSGTNTLTVTDNNRVQVYNAEFEWNTKTTDVKGFYRTGHYHWGYEGDFFGLYPEANYGPNLDIYNGIISGFEFSGKGKVNGLKAAFGPQLWWGANPAFLIKYEKTIANIDLAGIYHEDIANAGAAASSIAIPLPRTRRVSLYAKKKFGKFGVEVGGIWAGQPLNGRTFQIVEGDNTDNYITYNDKINDSDNWGGKTKITFSSGRINWYALGAITGLVANGGVDQTQTFTGWKLKDNGSGNQNSFLSGFTYSLGKWQIAPNFLWQQPLIAAIPQDAKNGARLRNIQDDPFAVRGNRKTVAGELLLTYDPTPGTWFYAWDNDRVENSKFAFNLGFTYRHLPTTMDAGILFLGTVQRVSVAAPSSVPAKDLWELSSRMVSKINNELGLIANIYWGNGQARGSDPRLIHRFGANIRAIYKKFKFEHTTKINDWGPYDYHRDFNLTFPVQLILDVSTSLSKPDWYVLPDTRLGIRGTWRSLDKYSPRYAPATPVPGTFPAVPLLSPVGFGNGSEWEIRTYLHINIGS